MRASADMADKHILFNFASRSRPTQFKKVCSFILQHCAQPYTIWAKVDTDDPALPYYKQQDGVVFTEGFSKSKIHAINRNIPSTGWDILVNVSDDTVFTVPGFDKILRDNCGPDDFLLFPEPFMDSQVVKGKNERIPILSVMGVDYYNRDGYVYHPDYVSLFCDNEAGAVARIRGRLKEIEQTIFYHHHPAAGYGNKDAQYRKTESYWDRDKATYLRRKAINFGL